MTEPRNPIRTYNDARDDFDDTFGADLTPNGSARRRVLIPAVGIIATGVCGILGVLAGIIAAINEYVWSNGGDEHFYIMIFNLCWIPLFIPVFWLMIVGGLSLKNLRRDLLARNVSYVVAGLGLFAIPLYVFGLWAAILIDKPEIRREFQNQSTTENTESTEERT